jgi:ATP-dependent protease ClpP protease subunit|tara:strand:+ start:1203 stop:1817 length:615 start_codon:yes stop_codon:yes gene_type:complete
MKDLFWEEKGLEMSAGGDPQAGSDDNNIVSVQDNKIYFYSEVSRPKILALNKSIVRVGNSIKNRSQVLGASDVPIELHICSYGGSVFSGFAAVDYILNSQAPVHSYIDGCAASAATIMSVVADERYMHRHSFMLIHQLSSGMWGNYEALRDSMENCDTLMETIRAIYEKHANIPKKELNDILKRDLWFDAEKCLKYGLVDHIIG